MEEKKSASDRTVTLIARGLSLEEAIKLHEYASTITHNVILKESKAGKL